MRISELQTYASLYRSAAKMGAAKILRDHLDIPEDHVIPLSISHGVDTHAWKQPIDVRLIEPVHWSYNQELHDFARPIKPSVLLPHPWAIIAASRKNKQGKGTLLIGPPPGASNDELLYRLLPNDIAGNCSILVKGRGTSSSSVQFWESKGITTVSAGTNDENFYHRLYAILEDYEYVLGCTISSALYLAASIGKHIIMLEDFHYQAFNYPDFLDKINFESTRTRHIVNVLTSRNRNAATALSKELLGFDLVDDKATLRDKFYDTLAHTTFPFFPPRSSKVLSWLMIKAALMTNRPGIMSLTINNVWGELNRKVTLVEINEFEAWTKGPTSSNLQVRLVRRSRTTPAGGGQ